MHKKTAYGASTAKKRDAIANMAREEIREKVEMVASADYVLQKRYMSTPPRKIDVYNDGEFDEEGEEVEGGEGNGRDDVDTFRQGQTRVNGHITFTMK